MSELKGKTLGLLGYGHIAQATAKLAKAFGMRVIALRRNAKKPDESGHLDMVLGPYEGPIQPAHKEARALRRARRASCAIVQIAV